MSGRALRCEDLTPNVIALFWEKVHKTASCWLWTAYVDRNAYGMAYSGKRPGETSPTHYAHRMAYAIAFGEAPAGIEVMHDCDNPSCVNPGHLLLGTHRENIADRDRKGRTKTESPRIRKISPEQVIEIRASLEHPHVLAARYGVHEAHIRHIRRGSRRKVA